MQRIKKSDIHPSLQNKQVLTRFLLLIMTICFPLFVVFAFLNGFWEGGYRTAKYDVKCEIKGIKNNFKKVLAGIFLPWEA